MVCFQFILVMFHAFADVYFVCSDELWLAPSMCFISLYKNNVLLNHAPSQMISNYVLLWCYLLLMHLLLYEFVIDSRFKKTICYSVVDPDTCGDNAISAFKQPRCSINAATLIYGLHSVWLSSLGLFCLLSALPSHYVADWLSVSSLHKLNSTVCIVFTYLMIIFS